MADPTKEDKLAPAGEKIKARSWLVLFILFAIISGFVVYYFAEIKKDFKLLEKVNIYWLIAAIVSQFLTYYFTAVIYWLLLNAQKPTQLPRLWDILKASLISLFFNQTMPSAGISGNTFILNFLSRFNMRITQIISLILAELLIFYAATEIIILCLLFAGILFQTIPHVITVTLVAGFVAYLVFGTAIGFTGKKKSLELLYRKIQKVKLIKRLFEKVVKKIQQQGISKNDVHLFLFMKNNKPTIVKAFLFQLMVVAADSFTIFSLFYGLGIHVSAFIVLLSLMSVKIVSLLPFLPGALLLYESSMSFFFVSLHMPIGTAIIVTLLYRLLSFWLPMPVGLLLYRKWLKNTAVNPLKQQAYAH